MKLITIRILIYAVSLLIIFNTSCAYAELKCISDDESSKNIITGYLVDASSDTDNISSSLKMVEIPIKSLSYYWLRGEYMRMPVGFWNPWPSAGAAFQSLNHKRYVKSLTLSSAATGFDPSDHSYKSSLKSIPDVPPGFALWVPSLRMVEINLRGVHSFTPCEPNRAKTSQDEYVIRFSFMCSSYSRDPSCYHRNAIKRILDYRSEHGRDRLRYPQRVLPIFSDGPVSLLHARCFTNTSDKCRGLFWLKQTGFVVDIAFPSIACQASNEACRLSIELALKAKLEEWLIRDEK